MRRTLLAGAVVGLMAALGIVAPAQAQPAATHPKALVRVFHAVPKVPVDVYLGSTRILDDFQPGSFSPALKVPAGTYTVRITAATAKDASHPIIGPAELTFAAHRNYTVVAHLTSQGDPTATLYRNVTTDLPDAQGRITVRHDAAAPPVDILVNGAVAMKHLTNPGESRAVLPAATYSAAVNLAGSAARVLGPTDVAVTPHTNVIVYAWGSSADGTLALAVQHVKLR